MAYDSPRRGCSHIEGVYSGPRVRRRGRIAGDVDVRNNVAVIDANAPRVALYRGAEPVSEPAALVSYLVPVSNGVTQGVVRVENLSRHAGTVEVTAIDDAGVVYGPMSLEVGARAVRVLRAQTLEEAVGDDLGGWVLSMKSDLDIEARAYAYTSSIVSRTDIEARKVDVGTEPPVWDRYRYRLVDVRPGRAMNKRSSIRVVNRTDETARVYVAARDDRGERAQGNGVDFYLPPGRAREVRVADLECGGDNLSGSLGEGRDQWRFDVRSDQPVHVIHLRRSVEGQVVSIPGSMPEQ